MPDEDIYGPIATEEEGDKIYEDLCSFKNSRASVVCIPLHCNTPQDENVHEV